MSTIARRQTSSFDFSNLAASRVGRVDFRARGGESRTPRHTNRLSNGRRYRPGDTVRQSGIYEVLHDRVHREAHEAVMISGEKFPDCDTCKEKVRFRLVRTAPYIFQDQDFEDDPS